MIEQEIKIRNNSFKFDQSNFFNNYLNNYVKTNYRVKIKNLSI